MGECGSLVKNAPGARSGSCDDPTSLRHASRALLAKLGCYCWPRWFDFCPSLGRQRKAQAGEYF